MRLIAGIVIGFICWPFEALAAMIGLDLLEHEQFAVPTPGYWSCFWVVVAGELLLGAVTATRYVTDDLLK